MWLCGCLGAQRGTNGVDAALGSPASGVSTDGHLLTSKLSKPALTDSETHDVQHDKDQGDAAVQSQLKQLAARPSPQRQPGPFTPTHAARLQQQRLQTWSPSHVSLDLPGLQQHASIAELQRQERTLRALLDKVHKFGHLMGSGSASMHAVQQPRKLHNPDITRLKEQIIAACSVQRPGPETHDRVAQLLQDLHNWLISPAHSQPSSSTGGSAIVLLHGAGEALAHAEHLARSAGQVQFWSAAVVRQLCALLRIYTTLIDQCLAASADPSSSNSSGCGKAFVDTLVKLLVRPSLVELLAQVLQLVHLDPHFKASAQRHEAVGAAIAALDFLRDVVRLARTHVVVVGEKRLGECLALLAGMLSPPDGLLPRILQQPLSVDTVTVQLHSLFLLQQLFDSPAEVLRQLLRPAGPGASFYLNHHLTEAARCYFASDGDPASACAELCMVHVRLLRSLCRGGVVSASAGLPVAALTSGPVQPQRINELLLSELSAEYEASQAVAMLAAEHDMAERSSLSGSGSSSASSDAGDVAAEPNAQQQQQEAEGASATRRSPGMAAHTKARAGGATGADGDSKPGKFEFTYDLNEDLARILELEEKLGEAVDVDGFDYDLEGKQLLQRNSVMAAEAAAAEVATAVTPGGEAATGLPVSRRPSVMAPNSSRVHAMSDGGRPTVPKLSFSSFSRSALSSSRSLAPTPSAAPSAAPSARGVPASPGRPLSTQPSSAVPAVACISALDEGTPMLRQLQVHHAHVTPLGQGSIRSMPPSPTSAHHVPSHLAPCLARHSPSRLSCVASCLEPGSSSNAPQANRRTSLGSVLAAGGPFAIPSVHFEANDSQHNGVVGTPAHKAGVGNSAVQTNPASGPSARAASDVGSAQSSVSAPTGSAALTEPVASAPSAAAAALPPAPRPPGIPVLDLSGLGSSSKNARSSGGVGSNSRRASVSNSTRLGSTVGSSAGRRQIPDSASDAAGKVGSTHRNGTCRPAAVDAAPAPASTTSARQLSAQPSSSASMRPPSASTTASTGFPPSGAMSAVSTATTAVSAGNAAGGTVTVTGDPSQRLLYRDPKLHANLLLMALEVSTTLSGQLDTLVWQQYPLDNGQQYNLEYLLTWHLNNGTGAGAVPELRRRLEAAAAQTHLPASGDASAPVAISSASLLTGNSQAHARAAQAQLRLLKLLSKAMFDSSRYSELKFMARGAYSNVYRAKARLPAAARPAAIDSAAAASASQQQQGKPSTPPQQQLHQQVIIKTVALPSSRYDRCVLPDIYGEIAIMDQYQGCPGICQMLDYGLTDDAFWIVMKKYRCSLAEWRQRQTVGPAGAPAAALYLSILLQVVAALKVLAHDSVVHFDLKCSNVLIDPHPGAKDSEIWNPLSALSGSAVGAVSSAGATSGGKVGAALPVAPFDAVLADFGEARSYRNADEAFTVRNRGTEVYKSPEMLLLNTRSTPQGGPAGPMPQPIGAMLPSSAAAPAPAAAAKAALQGAGLASDIWSLGCLAYELLSGKVLFGGDYASVTHRVAFGGRGNLTLTAAERSALGDRAQLVALLEWILARDPAQRPTLDAIEARMRSVQQEIWASA